VTESQGHTEGTGPAAGSAAGSRGHDPVRVGVIGARGRMGSLACTAVQAAPDLELVATVGSGDPLATLVDAGSQAMVDFTHPAAVMDHIRFAIDHEIHAVVGTSGVDGERLEVVRGWLHDHPQVGVIVVPNFGIGAVLAAKYAREAARFFASAEIVELHHPGKIDAPSATAVAAAREIGAARTAAGLGAVPDATTTALDGARGAVLGGVHVHSVRMPGLLAHLEVLLGNDGETLTIRQDSTSRESFVPGVLAAIRGIGARPGLTVGLEALLD